LFRDGLCIINVAIWIELHIVLHHWQLQPGPVQIDGVGSTPSPLLVATCAFPASHFHHLRQFQLGCLRCFQLVIVASSIVVLGFFSFCTILFSRCVLPFCFCFFSWSLFFLIFYNIILLYYYRCYREWSGNYECVCIAPCALSRE
jgi:hypothetical protein